MGKLERALGLILVMMALAACGGAGAGAEEPGGEETSGGDAAYEGQITSTDVDAGKELFSTHCDDCHPDGEEDVGPSLIAAPHSPAQLRKQVREGSGKMRPFSEKRISAEELESLLAYLQSINAVN